METRDQYVQRLKTQLDQWNAEMTKWEAKSSAAQADMRVQYEKQLEQLRQQRDQAMEQMQQIQKASGDAWMGFMRGTDEMWAHTREAFEKAYSQFQK